MRRIAILFPVLLFNCLIPLSAFAWNEAGHMTVARIAWNHLSPTHRDAVVSILRNHPHRDQILRMDRHNDATEAEWIFVRASVWADHIRPPRNESLHEMENHPVYRFHRASWHYVNFPYRSGQPSSALPPEPLRGQDESDSHILEQLSLCIRVLSNDSLIDPYRIAGVTHDENKAVRMCWLFHLVGDLHQPLHVATLVDEKRFSTGSHSDRGGNLLMIRPHAGAAPQNLHHYWDERSGVNSHFSAVSDLADSLTHDPRFAPPQLPELGKNHMIRQWAEESYSYAKSTIYHDGHLRAALVKDFEDRQITEDDVPILPKEAEVAAKYVARRRIVLAGYRLAGLIRQILDAK